MDPGRGPRACDDCETFGWQGPLHICQPRDHGHQVVPVRPQVPASTRYWGLIAFHRVGRTARQYKIPYLSLFAALGLLCLFFLTMYLVYTLTEQYQEQHQIIQPHKPSDLDQGGNPSSYERGAAGPQGPPGYPAQRIIGR